jgi:Ca2+-binding EF-hand superfamily protein
LQQYDTNHDGQIDASEVQTAGPRAAFLDGMLRRAGVEAKYPVKISAIQEAMHNVRNNGGGPFGPPGGSFGGPPGGGTPPGSETAPSSSDAKPAAAPAPLVPGFGVEQPKMAPVPGFDVVSKPGATVAASSVSAGGSESDSTPAMSPDQLDKTIRDHAAARMKQHDKNRSGALEKDQGEWDDLKDKDAKAMDRDRNGVITLEELTAFDMAENGVRPAKKSEPSHKAVATGAAATSSDSPIRTGKTYRILSPIERLPEGLPDWFARNDANGDGQISMAEFTRDWTPTKAAEYSRYDLNGDGMVTTDECLKIENAAEKK